MKLRKLLRQRALGLNLIAGFCFLLLAVYGWGLRWSELGFYLLAISILLGGLIFAAALCGYLLRRLMARGTPDSLGMLESELEREPELEESTEPAKPETKKDPVVNKPDLK